MSFPRRSPALAAVFTAAVLLLSGCFQPVTTEEPVTTEAPAATGEPASPISTPASVDVDDFEFASFQANYTLGRDADGVSTLTTVETLVPVFPEYDQNRGLLRRLVNSFEGNSTDLTVLSVTDGYDGDPREFEVEERDGMVFVTMAVPEGEYVHGEQIYQLTYTQRGVIGDLATGQEFFWEVNGTGWGQPFARVGTNIELSDDVAAAVIDASGCWFGPRGSNEECELYGSEGRYTAQELALDAGEGLTIRLVFAPGTFTA